MAGCYPLVIQRGAPGSPGSTFPRDILLPSRLHIGPQGNTHMHCRERGPPPVRRRASLHVRTSAVWRHGIASMRSVSWWTCEASG